MNAVEADPQLQEKLMAESDASAVAEIAKAAGFAISAEAPKNAQAEVSKEELESVAGGTFTAGVGCTAELSAGPFSNAQWC